jgi:CBS domain-containing protein
MAKLVQQLNARLFERAWQLVAPPDLVENSCLFVMGSEGRGEQLLKTDQDNGLVLRDGYAARPTWTPSASGFRRCWRALATPNAPAASWSATRTGAARSSSFTQRVRQWLLQPEATA